METSGIDNDAKGKKEYVYQTCGGGARGTKRRIERRTQELWFELDADRRAFGYK